MNNQHLRQLRLRKFRSHENLELKFDSNFIFFSGPNGIGKTNILEAISLFSPGRGLRFASIDELRSNSGSGNWNVFSVFEVERELMEIEIGLDDSNKKAVRVDGKKKPLIYIGTILKIIWLTPVMDRLWIGSSYERRRFLDRMVMNFFPDHPRDCLLYEQALRHRNQLFRDNHNDDAWFLAIEKQLAQIGYKIDSNRRKVLDILVKTYRSIGEAAFFPYLEMNLSPSKILNAEEFFDTLVIDRAKDRAAGRTLIGPHRSDLIVRHSSKNMEAKYCSTGEQKALLLSIFIANALAICNQFGKAPIILLDEIVAHLDKDNQTNLFHQLLQIKAQIFATGAEKISFKQLNLDPLFYELKLTGQGISCLPY
ncbi:MAG: DNA replication/repair protein RecF [Pseudomonadota bacterium]|nr:DNA replication/repair protein RecF [Pseudomonadota bacterium]